MNRHGTRMNHGPRRVDPPVRKVPADSVPYGSDISLNGKHCWAIYDDSGQLVCVGATSAEVRRKYRELVSH